MPSTDVIDTSAWQDGTNWDVVRASGVQGAIVKATEGTGYVSELFARDWAAVRRVMPYRGAYHFLRRGDGAGQARYFASVVGALDQPGDLPPVCDAEAAYGTAPTLADVLDFCAEAEGIYGRPPILYCSWSFVGDHLGNDGRLARYPLWVAAYNPIGWAPAPAPYHTAILWQFSSSGVVPGVNTRCDVNEIADHPTFAQLAAASEDDLPLTPQDKADIDALLGRSAGYVHAAVQADVRTAEQAIQARAQTLEVNLLSWLQQAEARDAARDQSLANAVASVIAALERHATGPTAGVDVEAVAELVVEKLAKRLAADAVGLG